MLVNFQPVSPLGAGTGFTSLAKITEDPDADGNVSVRQGLVHWDSFTETEKKGRWLVIPPRGGRVPFMPKNFMEDIDIGVRSVRPVALREDWPDRFANLVAQIERMFDVPTKDAICGICGGPGGWRCPMCGCVTHEQGAIQGCDAATASRDAKDAIAAIRITHRAYMLDSITKAMLIIDDKWDGDNLGCPACFLVCWPLDELE